MKIRPYTFVDNKQLFEVFSLNVPQYFNELELADFVNYLKAKGSTYFVIEYENKIIGGLGYELRENDKTGRINWVFLHPQFKGLGFGKQAVASVLVILKSSSMIDKLVVRTSQHAFNFFEKFNYKVCLIKKDYWAKGLDLYLMEQDIMPSNGSVL